MPRVDHGGMTPLQSYPWSRSVSHSSGATRILQYTVFMYSIRTRLNHRAVYLGHTDTGQVSVRMRSGRDHQFHWHGFTLEMERPVRMRVEAYTVESDWDPRNPHATLPRYQELQDGEYLLGSYDGSGVRAILPFQVV